MNTPRSILLIVAALLVCDWSSATMRPVLAATRAPGTQLWVARDDQGTASDVDTAVDTANQSRWVDGLRDRIGLEPHELCGSPDHRV